MSAKLVSLERWKEGTHCCALVPSVTGRFAAYECAMPVEPGRRYCRSHLRRPEPRRWWLQPHPDLSA